MAFSSTSATSALSGSGNIFLVATGNDGCKQCYSLAAETCSCLSLSLFQCYRLANAEDDVQCMEVPPASTPVSFLQNRKSSTWDFAWVSCTIYFAECRGERQAQAGPVACLVAVRQLSGANQRRIAMVCIHLMWEVNRIHFCSIVS